PLPPQIKRIDGTDGNRYDVLSDIAPRQPCAAVGAEGSLRPGTAAEHLERLSGVCGEGEVGGGDVDSAEEEAGRAFAALITLACSALFDIGVFVSALA
ncbi:MAG: hypothetical protein MJA30_12725, partial [Cytophagales bacterium]|nr:hypothetical protein [Cytophagales bacterium]